MYKVLQQALSVVDGGVELRIGVLPLPIQILSTQRTTMTTAERRRQTRGEEGERVEENRATAEESLKTRFCVWY